jgi:YVTN family beta-propeller protein
VFGIEGGVSGALQSAQNNVISTVLTGFGNSFAASPFTGNDITSYVNPFALGAPNGALTCNWWGDSGGPQNVPAGADPAVSTPWATAPIANGAGGSCDGTPVAPNLNAWTGVGDGASWSDGANWSKGVAPIETDSVVIAASGTYTVTIGAGLNPTIEHLLLGDASGTQTLDLNGNDLTVTNTATVEAGGDLFVRSSLTSGLGTTNRGQIRITGVVPSVSTLSGGLDNLGLVIARSANFTGPVTTGPSSTIRTEGAVDFGSGFTNNGLLEFGGDGTSGFVRIAGGSGTLVNAATGTLTSIAASGSTINRLIGNLENQGTVEVSEVQFNLAQGGAVLTNSGTINASGADLSLSTGSTGVLTTTGPINVSDGRLVQIQGPTLDIAAGGSIQGGGTLGFAGGALTTASNLVIGPGGLDSLRAFSATLSGPGSITVEAGGTLLFANTTVNSPVNSTGLITVLSTSSVSSAFVNQGTLDIRTGTLSFAAALTHGLGATLLGNGTLDLTSATVLGFDGAVNPGTSPGQLTITGPVTYGGTASLNIELAGTTVGTEYDQLIHTGAIGLNGQLVIDASGFTPTVGDRFAVLVFPSRIGGFAGVTLPTIAGLVLDTLWAEAGTTDTLFVVANAEAPPGPPGTETVWLGTVDGDWTNPANWFGGNVPDDTMNTFIPAGTPFTPVIGIGADLDVDTLVVEDGASLGVDGALTVYGDLAAGTTSISGGGSLTLAGVSGTVSGTVPDLTVAGNYTVTGDLVVNGDLLLQGFDSTAPDVPGTNLRINGNDVLVTGDFTTALFGRLHMLSAADTLEIQGNATFNGDETVNALTAGVLLVAGNFTQQGSIRSASFHPTGGHKTVLNGSATQTVSFENTALRLSTFASLEITNVVGVTFATPITALGTITVPVPIAISTLQRLEADGGLTLDPGASLTAPYLGFGGTLDVEAANFTVDTVAVSNGSLPGGLPYVTVYVVGAGGELLGPTTVSDDLHVQADFDVNGQTLVVAGNLIVSGGSLARLVMASPDDSVVVEGDATFNGAAYTGVPGTGLEAGVLEVQGNFTQTGTVGPFPAGGNNFVASGSHITHFTGPNPEISFSHPDSSWFHHVIMQTGESPVALLTDVTATGDLTIPLGVQGLQAVSSGITVLGAVTAESDLAVQGLGVFGTLNAAPAVYTVENTIFGGPSPQTIPDSLLYQNVSVVADASLMGDTDLTGILNVTGDPQGNTAGALTVGPYSLYVGQLVVNGSGILRMTDPGGVVNVTGNAIFDGSATVGELTAGELRVGGDFTQLDSNGDGLSFVADAGHVTEFQGDGPQNILFMSPGVGASQFGSLLITNSAAPVVLQSDARSVGASSIATSATLDLGTSTFDVNGAFTHPAGAVLQGSGTLDLTDATVSALDGVVNPGSSPGLLSLVAPSGLTLGSTAAVNIEVGGPTPGTEHDRLATSAAVTLDGAMNVALIDAFTPLAADSFEVLTFGTRTGNFSGVAPLALGGGLFLDTLWSATGMALVARRVVATDGSPIDLTTNTVSDRVYALVAPGTTTSVVVFDASTDQPLNTIPLPDAFNPYAVRVNPTSEKIYVSDFQGGVTVLDGLTGSITGTIAVSQPGFTTVDEANDLVYLTARVQSVSPCPPFTCSIDVPALLKIDGTMDTVFTADTVHIGGQNDQAFGIAFNPNDGFVYVAVYDAPGYVKIVDPATNALVDSIAVPDDPWAVALNPVTNRLYVSSDADNSVTVVDLATRSVVTSIPIGGYIPNLSVDPVLDRVYAVNFDNSTVVVIDGATSSVLKAVQVGAPGDGAYAAVPSPAAPAIYVARYNAGEITITRR